MYDRGHSLVRIMPGDGPEFSATEFNLAVANCRYYEAHGEVLGVTPAAFEVVGGALRLRI